MKNKLLIPLIILSFLLVVKSDFVRAQQYQVVPIGFYNLENLFDTIDSEGVNDAEYLATGSKEWDGERYLFKLKNMAQVIADIATDKNPDGIVILGISEIENKMVVEDLVKQEALKGRNYQVVHFDSPDRRGVDVGLIYNPKYFKLIHSYSAPFRTSNPEFKSRDQLVVSGLLLGEEVHFIVNHWPSRSGGEKKSRPNRNAAAQLSRDMADSLLTLNPNAKIMIMGDLNDDPNNESVAKILKATDDTTLFNQGYFYNPFKPLFKKGIGSLAYRDSWNLFDQIIITPALMETNATDWKFHKALVFKKPYMMNQEGSYKGYPKRTHVGNTFQGGYSDHFPVYIYLIREVK